MDARIDEILKELQNIKIELKEFKALITERINTKEKELTNIVKELEGNGKKGIKSRIDELEKFQVKVISYATIIFLVVNLALKVIIK